MKITTKTIANVLPISGLLRTAAVVSLDQDNKTIVATGDITGFLDKDSRINFNGSTGNDRTDILYGYTVVSATENGGNTDIVIKEDIPHATADGDIEYHAGIDKVNKLILVDGNQTADFTAADIIEIVSAENSILNGGYKVDSDSYNAGDDVTEIEVEEDILSVLWGSEGKVQFFDSATANFFMAKSIGTRMYNLYPQGISQVGKISGQMGIGEDSISINIPDYNVTFVFPFSELRDPEVANIDAAIVAIQAIVNP